jgi:hypothetical protein
MWKYLILFTNIHYLNFERLTNNKKELLTILKQYIPTISQRRKAENYYQCFNKQKLTGL